MLPGEHWSIVLNTWIRSVLHMHWYSGQLSYLMKFYCSDILVYGWLNDTYDGEERYRNHILYLGFRKGGESLDMSGPLLFNVISIDGEGVKGWWK